MDLAITLPETGNLEAKPITKSELLPSLNGFRGISIILVILSHFYFQSPSVWLRIFSGYYGVTIFFVISGYLITTLLLKEKFKSGKISLSRFYIRRALRIIPVSYLFILVLILLNYVFQLKTPIYDYLSALLYLKNTPFLHNNDPFTAHFWTLSIEEQFYIIFPWILSLSLKAYTYLITLFIILLPMGAYADFYHLGPFKEPLVHIGFSLIGQTSPILIGSLTAILIFQNPLVFKKIFNPSSFFNILILIFSAYLLSDTQHYLPSVLKPTLCSILVMYVLLNHMQKSEHWFYKLLNSSWMNYIGILSYSLYIWQQIFTFHLPWKSFLGLPNTPWVNLILLILVSYISYNYYEKFFLSFKNKFK
jgi:peptidoglycan/LPS O-acetylase OafA/YrhL